MLDAHIPPSLCFVFREKGNEAIHTKQLPNQNESTDTEIATIAEKNNYIIITKDTDFYYRHITNNKPEKLLLVKTGNMSTQNLMQLFYKHFDAIINAFIDHNLVELHKDSLLK